MKKTLFLAISVCIMLASISLVTARYSPNEDLPPEVTKESSEVTSTEEESEIAFNKMMDVLTHQRCMNCHPSDNVPKQGEDSHPHRFDITRVNSMNATNCNTCHQASNNDYSGVPGAPEWSLAPEKMYWEGLSRIEIAQSMMNPENNGSRTPEDVMHHLTEHELVLWAWEPGVDAEGIPRELPPVPVDEYIEAVKTWIELGAVIPTE
ncbi:MAG: hypothetical protein RIF33_21850 [Cyclobacteriaceae bacterium]